MTRAEILKGVEDVEALCWTLPTMMRSQRIESALATLAEQLRCDANADPPADPTLATEIANLKDVITSHLNIIATHERWAESHLARISDLTARLESQERYYLAEIARQAGE